MKNCATTETEKVLACLSNADPIFWINPQCLENDRVPEDLGFDLTDVLEAEARLGRFAPVLAALFPELESAGGIIESDLAVAHGFRKQMSAEVSACFQGHLLIKCDHALPVAGSIKARGGIYAVLCFAEQLALANGLLDLSLKDFTPLLSSRARSVFARYTLSVASTGNLGLSVGIMGAGLGFSVNVFMSTEAKEWKKTRLRDRGVRVIEDGSDFTAACISAREEAAADNRTHFIDDENSTQLFMGYSVAALRLKRQLIDLGYNIGPESPLFLYLPCGVGGGAGGITFGSKMVFGEHVHCFLAEPVQAPCVTLGMITGKHSNISVYDIGLTLDTDADGLAVSRPSTFVGQLMSSLASGGYTMTDKAMYDYLIDAWQSEEIEIEPSAAAGFDGPVRLLQSDEGIRYLQKKGLADKMDQAVHVVWTTGGSFVPASEHALYRKKALTDKPKK